MICKACGATIPEESAFCNKCGQAVGEPISEKRQKSPLERFADEQEQRGTGQEEELWEGRMSWKAYGAWFMLLAILGIVFFFFLVTLWFRGVQHLEWLGYPGLFIWLALFVWLVIKVLKMKLTLRYRLTSQRLFLERGFLSKTTDEVELIRVDDVTVQQGVIQRIFEVGDVVVIAPTDASDARTVLLGIENPVEVKELIREYAQRRRKKSLHVENL